MTLERVFTGWRPPAICAALALLAGCGPASTTPDGGAVCPPAQEELIDHDGGVISRTETWAGDGRAHLVSGDIRIQEGGSLVLAPCARLLLTAGVRIEVQGGVLPARLVAQGDANRPVSFARAEATQGWGRIDVSGVAEVDLAYTTLKGGVDDGHGLIWATGQNDGAVSTTVKLDHVVIEQPGGIGVELGQGAAFAAGSQALSVRLATVVPVRLDLPAVDTAPQGVYQSNGENVIDVTGRVSRLDRDATLKDLGAPYRFRGDFFFGSASKGVVTTLTLEAGAKLRFRRGGRLVLGSGGSPDFPAVLVATGTASKPVTLDSDEGGPAAGDWVGVQLHNGPGSRLESLVISNAGGMSAVTGADCRPAGSSADAALLLGGPANGWVPEANLLAGVTIWQSAGHGISSLWQGTAEGPDLTAGNTFTGINGCKQTLNGFAAGCPRRGCLVP